MLVPLTLLAAACSLLRPTQAVLIDDAWTVDYHLALLGAPLEHTTSFQQPFVGSKASLLYTLSEQAVLGAVNPKDGSLVWRQQLLENATTTASFLRSGEGQDTVVSGIGGQIAAWSAADGRQVWNHDLEHGSVKDLEILELPGVGNAHGPKDAIVLSAGAHTTLSRLDGETGLVKWSFREDSGDEAYQISASATEVFAIFLHNTMLGGVKIKVVSLDPTNGRKIDQYLLNSEGDLSSAADIISVGANTASPIIAWSDKAKSVLKVNVIGNKHLSTFAINSATPVETIALHAPYNINARPHFLVHYQTATEHWAEVFHVDLRAHGAAIVDKAYSLPKLGGHGAFSTSTSDANVYFSRISEGEVSVVSSASHGVLARWPLKVPKSGSSQSDTKPLHAVAEVSVKADTVSAIRAAVYLESGDWILIRDGILVWYRPEALSQIESAVWAYPTVSDSLIRELDIEGHSNPISAYTHRVTRHIGELSKLPAYLSALPTRLLSSVGVTAPVESSLSTQDMFGYHKTIVCATSKGRLIALDAGSAGKTLWNVPMPASSAAKDIELVALADGSILVSADKKVLHVIDSLTGQELAHDSSSIVSPQSKEASYLFSIENGRLVGRSPSGEVVWQFTPSHNQEIATITLRPYDDPVASIGKALGDRRVLYKYLNPNILMVTTLSHGAKTATISIIDTVSGAPIYTAVHEDVDTSIPIASVVSENWFAYSLTSVSALSTAKGHQLVVGEMYESELPNDRGPLGSAPNTSAIQYGYEPHVITQTFAIAERISHMGVSQTRQGITSRLLLAVLPEANAVIGIPRTVIDPRRPVGRDAVVTEQMEGLTKYDPVLRFDPKWYLTHQREVMGIKKVTTSPAILESTSLIFAYGLDVFGTRVNPSFSFDVLGKDFNKIQMLATVVALFVATLAVEPLVKRKQINARWQFAG